MANNKNQGAVDLNETLNKSEAFFNKYKKPIIIALAAIIVLIVGLFLYKSYVSGPRENKASTALAKGQEYFMAEKYDVALNGDSTSFAGFAKLAKQYSGTKAGNLANLYAGLCYANLDKWEDAVKFLDAYTPASDQMVGPAATAALGNAYAHIGQTDKAVNLLKKAAEKADKEAANNTNNSISPTFLLQAGEILESEGKKDEALKLYKSIKEKYVNSPLTQTGEVDKYIERATR